VDNTNDNVEIADFLKGEKNLAKLVADIAEIKAQVKALLFDVNSMINELE